ncbi:hypothetical protein D6D13_09526 [Aureobasidium pullulans]|uniref:Uncharacterized protein n=1 Tax=Aureobasidium pullulans TaxID=5580 RepID=A0A4S9C4H8_AURPU|nr:hypothetical protein D6D13_09526 [Aureobasidium pullulans]
MAIQWLCSSGLGLGKIGHRVACRIARAVVSSGSEIYISDLERAVPGLLCEQLRPPRRKSFCGVDAPSTPGSTMSTLTEFTEDNEIQLSTPTSIPSSPVHRVSQDDGANTSSCASPASTLTAFSGENHTRTSSFPPLLTSLYTLTDLDEISNPFSVSLSPASSMSALTDFSEYASSISTLTDFTSVASSSTLSSPPSSLSSLPPTLSTPIPTPPQRAHRHQS